MSRPARGRAAAGPDPAGDAAGDAGDRGEAAGQDPAAAAVVAAAVPFPAAGGDPMPVPGLDAGGAAGMDAGGSAGGAGEDLPGAAAVPAGGEPLVPVQGGGLTTGPAADLPAGLGPGGVEAAPGSRPGDPGEAPAPGSFPAPGTGEVSAGDADIPHQEAAGGAGGIPGPRGGGGPGIPGRPAGLGQPPGARDAAPGNGPEERAATGGAGTDKPGGPLPAAWTAAPVTGEAAAHHEAGDGAAGEALAGAEAGAEPHGPAAAGGEGETVIPFPVRLLHRDAGRRLAVRVDARELGPIHVDVRRAGEQIELGLRALRPETADLLGQHLPELVAGLRTRRLDVSQAGVFTGFHPQADGRAGHPDRGGHGHPQRSRRAPAAAAALTRSAGAAAAAAGGAPAANPWWTTARLDVMA
ncbi:MAG: flagellar hook-length control protein FliK [Bacillota bacterium]